MTEKEIRDKARELLMPWCRVCPDCNGIACRGEVPGMGGKGTGKSFIKTREVFSKIDLNMKVLHDVKKADTSVTLFGQEMSMPVFAAPVTGTTLNMGGKKTEREYIEAVVNGCNDKGILAMVGDTAVPEFLLENLKVIKESGKPAITFIKPWENEIIIEKMKDALDAGSCALGVDVDAAGLVTLNMHGKGVLPKTPEQIKELCDNSKVPFIVKGVLTLEDAETAYKAGASAIVISNHGGRVLDYARPPIEALPEIAEMYKGKMTLLIDGGVRDGIDVFKLLALGADGVLIGRPFITYSFGGGREGVALYVNRIKTELEGAMLLCGAKDIASIDKTMITWNK